MSGANANRLLTPPALTVSTSTDNNNNSSSELSPESNRGRAFSDGTLPSLQVPLSPTNASLSGDTLRSRASSFRSQADSNGESSNGGRPRGLSEVGTVQSRYEGDDLTPEEALAPVKGTEADFQVENNPFAFTPGQMNKLLFPKSLAAFKALGGPLGLEKGLQTDLLAGLSVDETTLDKHVSYAEATAAPSKSVTDTRIVAPEEAPITQHTVSGQFTDRHRVFKDNRLPAKKTTSIWELLWNAYNDRILMLLTIAAIVSLALGIYEATRPREDPTEPQPVDWIEGVAIIVAILVVVIVTALNDYRRDREFNKLNAKKDDRQVKVIRSGKTIMISVYDVTVGDILHLESGDSLPADGVLVSGYGVTCDESSATGESDAMKKMIASDVWTNLQEGTATNKMDPFVISGSKILEGVGTYVVTAVGVNSSHGKIMMSLQDEVEATPLQAKLGILANWIGALGSSAAGVLFFVLLFRFLATLPGNTDTPEHRASIFTDILIVAVTIIVVAVPEGLPLSVTLALSFATKRMYKENNLVRHLRACETMGNATAICSDKTGTLTQNKMTVVAGTLGTNISFAHETKTKEDDEKTLTFASAFGKLSTSARILMLQSIAMNSTAFEGEENGVNTFIGSKTETALLQMAKDHLGMGPLAEERAGVEIVQLIPFDSNRKCMGVVIRLANGTYRLLVKGAAEIMLAKANKEVIDLSDDSLDDDDISVETRGKVEDTITDYAKQSLRTIGMLFRDFPSWPPVGARTLPDDKHRCEFEDIFEDMTFIGVVGIQDPLREGVAHAVKQCQMAGIKVRMVTGDNITTATAIATECGIRSPDGVVMEGPHFRQLSDEELDRVIPKLDVLARSSPEDKRILVARLKHLGETVAVTGDGTNDAPALKTADIGFSMGIAGTEVAKEASSIILLDDNFRSIVVAIMWGRAVNDAVSKFLQFQITVNITAVIVAFVSAVSSEDMHPVLTAVQLLWVNLIMDTFAALALATDPPTEKILDRPPAPKSAALITTNMWKMILGQSVYQLTVTLVIYFAGESLFNYNFAATSTEIDPSLPRADDQRIQRDTIVFNAFVWMQIFNEFNNRRLDNKLNIFEGLQRNPFFIFINFFMVGMQVMIIYVGGRAFEITSLNSEQWAISVLVALPCMLWAILLRFIPDPWAAVVFHYAQVAWLFWWRPAYRFVFRPTGHFFRGGYRSIRRVYRRARGKPVDDADENRESDVEAVSPSSSNEKQPVTATSEKQPEKPATSAGNPPPITLTTVN